MANLAKIWATLAHEEGRRYNQSNPSAFSSLVLSKIPPIKCPLSCFSTWVSSWKPRQVAFLWEPYQSTSTGNHSSTGSLWLRRGLPVHHAREHPPMATAGSTWVHLTSRPLGPIPNAVPAGQVQNHMMATDPVSCC